jgi:hypothetical protein
MVVVLGRRVRPLRRALEGLNRMTSTESRRACRRGRSGGIGRGDSGRSLRGRRIVRLAGRRGDGRDEEVGAGLQILGALRTTRCISQGFGANGAQLAVSAEAPAPELGIAVPTISWVLWQGARCSARHSGRLSEAESQDKQSRHRRQTSERATYPQRTGHCRLRGCQKTLERHHRLLQIAVAKVQGSHVLENAPATGTRLRWRVVGLRAHSRRTHCWPGTAHRIDTQQPKVSAT